MHLIQLDELREALDTAINGRLCVQTWLGYAQVLFIGFGAEVLPPQPPGKLGIRPDYELQTHYADWQVEDASGVVATADDEYDVAEAAAERLVGHRAVGWRHIDDSVALEIAFEGGLKLVITPMSDSEESILHKEAWALRMPDEYYRCVRWDLTAFVLHRDEPCTNAPD